MTSIIQAPITSDPIGTFNNIAYVRHRGQFSGATVDGGAFAVPYEITAPANPSEGNETVVMEPPHFTSGAVARDAVLGPDFLFGKGFRHAMCGFGNLFLHSLNPNPGFPIKIKGSTVTVDFPPLDRDNEVIDLNILRQFAFTLKQSPPSFLGKVVRVYGTGCSDSGQIIHQIYEPFGHKLFDLTFVGTAPYREPFKVSGQNPIMVFNTEWDFDPRAIPDPRFPQYRWYAVAGPHIPDSVLTRRAFPGGPGPIPPVAGTSPINWLNIFRALFFAGDQWVRNGTAPPAGVTLRVNPQGIIARDVIGNALGGIRHPAMETGEARFFDSVVRNGWELFGGYGHPKRLTESEFPQYLNSFKQATQALVAARYLLPAGGERLIREVQLQPPNTFTLNYMEGLLLPD
jgi:hypothetical protein